MVVSACGFDSVPAELGLMFNSKQWVPPAVLNKVEAYLCLESEKRIVGNFAYESAVLGVANAEVLRELRKSRPKRSRPQTNKDGIYLRKKKHDNDKKLEGDSSSIMTQLVQFFCEYRIPDSCLYMVLLASAMVGSRTWFGGILHRPGVRHHSSDKSIDFALSPTQEQRLQKLKGRIHTAFDETRPDHQEGLRRLWRAAFPNVHLKGLISEQWKDMGWQGSNPSTDFRGCGFLALENLLFLAQTYPVAFHRLLFKQEGRRARWEYPFAVAGVNLTFMLTQMLDLYSEKPKCVFGRTFVKILGEDEQAFDILYCIAFVMMDAEWLAMDASYMQFKEVLEATRKQLERELSLEDVSRICDLPAYNLLYK